MIYSETNTRQKIFMMWATGWKSRILNRALRIIVNDYINDNIMNIKGPLNAVPLSEDSQILRLRTLPKSAPLICQLCALSWERHNPDYTVVKLDMASIHKWLPGKELNLSYRKGD